MGADCFLTMNIRTALYVFAAALALAAVASAESSNEQSFAEATSFVQAFMGEHAEKGGDSACRKVASDSIKAIKTECDALQKTVDTAAKGNQKCCSSGKDAVCSAEKSKGDLGGKSSTCKGKADALANAKITFTSSLDALKNGKCKSIHGSDAYKNKKAQHRSKMKECNKLSGAASEAKKALKTAIASAKKARRTCNKDAQTALDEAYKTAKKACNTHKNMRAFTRAQHMKCVLDGKSLKRCKVGKYPLVKKTALSKLTCDATTTCKGKEETKPTKKKESKGPTAGPGAGSTCRYLNKSQNGPKILGSNCGNGAYNGCHIKANGYKKISEKGGCCASKYGRTFHRRCHCNRKKASYCKAMCEKDSGCLGYVSASHGCQWATISDSC